MKYRLGLDLGVGSIGSAVVALDNENNVIDIIDTGVRIFEVSEGAEDRRLKRTARKNLVRTHKRLELLALKLYQNNLWVNETPEGSENLRSKSPYKIRNDALYGKLKHQNYIGRALLHIAKHRGAGFVSAAADFEEEVLDEGEKSKAKKTSYDMMWEHLKKSNSQTIGEFFYKRIQDNENPKNHAVVRQKEYAVKAKIVDYAIPRYLVKDEFHKIWDTQAQYFPQMQKEGLKQEIYDILFYEKAPVPYATGKCIYFTNEDRLLKAHPLSEMRRIYEEVNNIRILDDMNKRKLTIDERDKIINDLLMKGQNAGKQSIKKALNLTPAQKISLVDDRIIKAFLYATESFSKIDYINKMSFDELSDFISFLAEPKNPNDIQGHLYNEDALVQQLKSILKIDDEKEIGQLLTKIPKGRGMLGLSATKIILEKLKQSVLSHREITDELAKTDTRFMAEEEIARQMQGKYDALPYYGSVLQTDTQPLPPFVIQNNKSLNADEAKWGRIANPAVHMILNQIRLVVNEIVRIYGKPYDINLELGRDVGLSSKKKKQKEFEQRSNEKLNEEAKKHLAEHKIFVNRTNILKYKLAKEQGWVDAYNPKRKISQNFMGFEIEHIIPQAKGGSDTYSNLCLVGEELNKLKKDQYAYEFFEDYYKDTPEMIREILKNARVRFSDAKRWRLEADARENFEEQGDENETNRLMTDTRYVSKMAARYLRMIVDSCDCDEVIHSRILAVKGQQTAELRKRWDLLGLEYDLMGLDIPRYAPCNPHWIEQETGEIVEGTIKPDIDGHWKFYDREKNKQWLKKPRIDHRHHAMDAVIVACASRSLVQQLSNETDLKHADCLLPFDDLRTRLLNVLKNVNVSHKPDHSKAGQFHKETGRTVLCQNPNDKDALVTVYSRKVLNVVKSFKDLNKMLIPDTIKDEWHESIAEDRKKITKLVQDFELYSELAKQQLTTENEEAVAIGKKELALNETRILTRAFHVIKEKGLWKNDTFRNYENKSSLVYIKKHGVAYDSGNNHCVDFYVKDGKIGWEIIRRFDANQADFVPEWKKQGAKILWSIQQGDLLELDTPDEWKSYTDKPRCIAKVKKFSEGELVVDYTTDARMTSPLDKSLKYMFVNSLRKGLGFFIKNKARKIELTPFGKMKRRHKVLFNGTKTAS